MEPRHPLRVLRDHLGLTQKELAQWMEYSNSYVSALEQGDHPISTPFLMRLLEIWEDEFKPAGVTIKDLLRGEPMMPRQWDTWDDS